MVNGVGQSGLSRAALESAIQRMQTQREALRQTLQPDAASGGEGSFRALVEEGIGAVDSSVRRAENVHLEVLRGELDLHEVATLLKQSELSFDFAMKVRNKFVDAYREVMRMSV
jgi:flagellar hook-basal body complex protein FliE